MSAWSITMPIATRKALTAIAVLGVMTAATAAATTADPALQARNPRLKIQWSGEQTRTPPFDKVLLAPVELDFRPAPPLTGVTRTDSSHNEYPVSDRQREELKGAFAEIFREQLGKNKHFTLSDEPGPGVLIVKPALRDIVSRVPPEEPPGRSAVYVDSVADATLVVDLVDPASEQMLGRAIDRRTAEPVGTTGGFGAVRAVAPTTNQEMRRLLRSWALNLDKRLEQLYFDAKPK
jgi:hypothetical protein